MSDITTIDIMGNKEVIIDTKGNEKKRISALLTIAGNGSKLPTVLIFKGKKGKFIEKEINGNIHVLRKEIFSFKKIIGAIRKYFPSGMKIYF